MAPFTLTLILSPLMERGLQQSLEISEGSFTVFFTRPVSLALLVIALLFVMGSTPRAVSPIKGADTQV